MTCQVNRIISAWRDRFAAAVPDLVEAGVVLAAVKTAARRLRRWPSASLDRHCARRCAITQAGAEKRPKLGRETSSRAMGRIASAEPRAGVRS
jgi:hypothetical protein